ncbi:MAG: hypothetical protein WD872_11825 [Pirellulaceae bacterium]
MTILMLFIRRSICVAALLAVASPPLSAAEPIQLADVLRVWRKRESAARTLRFDLVREYVRAKGTLTGINEEQGTVTTLPESFKSDQRVVLVIDGVKMRYERIGDTWAPGIEAPAPETMIAVFDGARQKIVHERQQSDDRMFSQGWVRSEKRHPDAANVHLSPIIRHFRPTSPVFGVIGIDRLQVERQDEMVDGLRCVILKEALPDGLRARKYWVAPDREMGIVRYVGYFQDQVETEAEVAFKRDPKLGWVPDRWRVASFVDGALVTSATTQVASEQLNLAVAAATFDFTFPVGTQVNDRIAKRQYLVKPGRTNRVVLPIERTRGATYSELMQTNPGEAGRRAAGGEGFGYMSIVIIALLLLAGGIVLTLLKRSSLFPFSPR